MHLWFCVGELYQFAVYLDVWLQAKMGDYLARFGVDMFDDDNTSNRHWCRRHGNKALVHTAIISVRAPCMHSLNRLHDLYAYTV